MLLGALVVLAVLVIVFVTASGSSVVTSARTEATTGSDKNAAGTRVRGARAGGISVKDVNECAAELAEAADGIHQCVARAVSANEARQFPRAADLTSLARAKELLRGRCPALTADDAEARACEIERGLQKMSFVLREHTKAGMPVQRALAAEPGAYEDFTRHVALFSARVDQFHRTVPPCDC